MKFADLSFYYNKGETDAGAILQRHRTNLEYVRYLPEGCQCAVIKFMEREAHFDQEAIAYHFFRGERMRHWYPNKLLLFLKRWQPDVILVHGFIYSWQVWLLGRALGPGVKIILQHHGEVLPGYWRRWLMKQADARVHGYFFAAKELANSWIQHQVISHPGKVFEVLTGSAAHQEKTTISTRQLEGNPVCLWVGRLDTNKDPLTLLEAFSLFVQDHPGARLYLIFQSQELLEAVTDKIRSDVYLKASTTLVGEVPHESLNDWYQAADFFVAASRREACGYALLEAMSCGCIPVVTDIHSFRRITANGTKGFLFEAGDANALVESLKKAMQVNRLLFREEVVAHFQQHLSYPAIAKEVTDAIMKLIGTQRARRTTANTAMDL